MVIKKTGTERVLYTVVFIIFVLYSISILYPVFWLVQSSLKEPFDYAIDIAQGKPFKFTE